MICVPGLLDDLVFGLRLLRKHLVLSVATVVTFTIGIGLNAGVFTVINGLLFRPRVAHDPASFVEVRLDRSDASGPIALPFASLQDYDGLRHAASLRDVAAWTPVHAVLGEQPGTTVPLLVSCNFFTTYGPDRPLLGRPLRPEDCAGADTPPVVVIGEDLWRTMLAARADVIGTSLRLNRHAFTIVGVMPSGYAGQLRAPIWVPFTAARVFFDGRDLFRERTTPWLLGVVGRLQPGLRRPTAAAELAVLGRQLDATVPNQRTTFTLTGGAMIDEPLVREAAGWGLPLIVAALAAVLMIACTNVALLLLSRSMARQHEIAVRISLGASRGRLLQMLLVESALLAAIAVPPSLAVAASAPRVLRALIPQLPYYPFAVDSTVLGYLGAVTLLAGIVAGVAPAFESLKSDVNAVLHGQDALPGASGWRSRDVLVAAQVGMSLALLVGAGLLLHAEVRLLSANPGYDIDRVMLVSPRVSVPPHTLDSATSFYKTFTERALGVPGVHAVAYARGAADEKAALTPAATIVAVHSGVTATATMSVVSSEYFRALRIPMIWGKTFGDDPSARRSVVISESLARTLWPDHMPVGETARLGDADVSITGVVRDVQSIVSGGGELTVYSPAAAVRAGDVLYIGFEGAEAPTARALRDAIAALDPEAAVQPVTLAAIRRDQATKFMPFVEMAIGLGAVGLVLGIAGIYGVVSFAVGRRTREMGIRIALGATRANIMAMVIGSGAVPVGVGTVGGLGFAFIGARSLARMFAHTPVHMEAWDPGVYLAVVLLLSTPAVVAMIGPARRAATLDPVHALRQD
jgi:putative ABC transport system permease protein